MPGQAGHDKRGCGRCNVNKSLLSSSVHLLLALVHGSVGAVEHLVHVFVHLAGIGDAVSEGDLLVYDGDIAYRLLHAFGTDQGSLPVGVGAKHHELVATHAEQHIGFAEQVLAGLDHGAEQQVARLVTELVIHTLESIQIKINHGEMGAIALATGEPFPQSIDGVSTVITLGQVIGKGNVAQVLEGAAQPDMHVDTGKQNFGGRKLAHKIRRSGMEPLGDALGVFPAGKEYDGQVIQGMALANAQANLVAVQAGHVDVQEHQVKLALVEQRQSLFTGGGRNNAIAHLTQEFPVLFQELGAVITDENLFFYHALPL